MINSKASNWVDRGEPVEPTLMRVLASYLHLDPTTQSPRLLEYVAAVRGMAEADATEVHIMGYLRTLEELHARPDRTAGHRRGVAIALWHITKSAEVRDRAIRLLAAHRAAAT